MFIVDFDDTLFDTHHFKHARQEDLAALGVSKDLYWQTYHEARSSKDGLATYSNERHAKMLAAQGFPEEKVLMALENTTGKDVKQFLFPDAVNLINFLKAANGPLVLLSLGDPSMQELKVRGVGIHDFFDRVFFVDDSKEHVLKTLFGATPESAAWLINDKVQESLDLKREFPKMRVVLKKSDSIDEVSYQESGLPYFRTLTSLQKYVASQLG